MKKNEAIEIIQKLGGRPGVVSEYERQIKKDEKLKNQQEKQKNKPENPDNLQNKHSIKPQNMIKP